MGMFNSIFADIYCPRRKEVGRETEIQIKWQFPELKKLAAYRLGDVIDGIQANYDNAWIRTDYICNVCSPQMTTKEGITFIKVNDQQRHTIFVRVENGRIRENPK